MSAIESRSAHAWAATHRGLLALVASAVALAVSIVIVLMTSSGPAPSSTVRAPDQGQTDIHDQGRIATPNQLPAGAQDREPADTQKKCLQYMGVRPC